MAQDNPTALARFKPGAVDGGAGAGERNITIKTNLAGEAIRFTLSEDINSIVSSGTLIILNADISELGEIEQGVLGGNEITEEDESLWGTIYQGASAEPNQRVVVTEIIGAFDTNVDEETGLETYTLAEENTSGEICTTYWRIVDFTAYLDKEGIPYCDIKLESLSTIAFEAKFDPANDPVSFRDDDQIVLIDVEYFADIIESKQNIAGEDGYVLIQTYDDLIYGADEWMAYLFEQITNAGFEFSGEITGVTYIPCWKAYTYGESVWQAIDDILSFNKILARFKRDLSLVQWSADDEGYGETYDIGDFGSGIQFTYSKAGVANKAEVKGYIGAKNEQDHWIPFAQQEEAQEAFSHFGNNILNGEDVKVTLSVSADYLLKSTTELQNWGEKELYKTCLTARGVSVESDSLPFEIEVGNKVVGTSQIAGTAEFLILSLNRTTDAQQNTTTTSLTGRAYGIGGPSDSWI